MNIVYLIGNGFDLSLGLNTDPKSFIKSYIEEKVADSQPDYVTKLVKDIKAKGIATWADFEWEVGKYSTNFADEDYGTADDYARACSDLFESLCIQLEKENARITDRFIEANATQCLKSITSFEHIGTDKQRSMIGELKARHANEHWAYDLLTFNYTDVLDQFKGLLSPQENPIDLGSVGTSAGTRHILQRVRHPHETLDGDNPIVCGVNDISQIAYEPFREERIVIDTLAKENLQRDQGSESDIEAKGILDSAKIICVYGMSLGRTDERWWQETLSVLTKDPEALLILMSHDLCNENRRTAYESHVLMQRMRGEFFDAAGLDDEQEKEELSKRIFVIQSTEILRIPEPLPSASAAEEAG